MRAIKAIWVFYLFKIAPRTIEPKNTFWYSNVKILNSMRTDKFYLCKIFNIYIRDPHAYPLVTHFTYSKIHPFCVKKKAKP